MNPDLKKQFNNQPWRWRDDWESGEISTHNKKSMIGSVILAVLWNAFFWGLAIAILPGELRDENYLVLMMLLFPLAGIILAVVGFRSVRRYMKFGESTFQMAVNPGVIGGPLTGVIRTSTRLNPANGFRLTLNCIRREIRGSGKNRRRSESVLWQSMQTMSGQLSTENPNESGIPVQFAIPFKCEASSPEGANSEGVLWKLELAADDPGVDYLSEFEVPVFKTEESSANFEIDTTLVEDYVHVPTMDEVYREARVERSASANGIRIKFPLFRDIQKAIGMTFVSLFWFGMTALLGYNFIDLANFGLFTVLGFVFFGIFSLAGLILLAVTVELWFWHGTISVTKNQIEINTGLVGFNRPHQFSGDEIKSITFKRSMQAGKIIYHDLHLETKNGKRHCIGRRIANDLAVRQMIDDIKNHLGMNESELRNDNFNESNIGSSTVRFDSNLQPMQPTN